MTIIGDKKQYPVILRTLNTLVYKYRVPIEYIIKQVETSSGYYKDKPVYALYGLRTLFWAREFTV